MQGGQKMGEKENGGQKGNIKGGGGGGTIGWRDFALFKFFENTHIPVDQVYFLKVRYTKIGDFSSMRGKVFNFKIYLFIFYLDKPSYYST